MIDLDDLDDLLLGLALAAWLGLWAARDRGWCWVRRGQAWAGARRIEQSRHAATGPDHRPGGQSEHVAGRP